MTTQKRFLLRSTSGLAKVCESPVYLVSVRRRGLTAHFTVDPAAARRFTAKQRDSFMCQFGHITGRWVLEKTALRIEGSAALDGAASGSTGDLNG